jgi:phage recombination protein Bet
MSNLATTNGSAMASWDASQIEIIKNQIAKGCSDGELQLFGQVCTRTGLDPFSHQIYAITRMEYNKETRTKEPKMTIQISIDGFRTIAARSGLYGGSSTEWCGEDGVWRDAWLSSKPPAAAKTTVYRKGSAHPFTGVARFDSYAQSYDGKLSGLWAKMSDLLIGKCSESLALRKAFPAELSGLYTSEEMEQADDSPIATTPIAKPAPVVSTTIQDRQQALRECMESLKWSPEHKATWTKSICPKPMSTWTIIEWDLLLVKALAAINQLNQDISESQDIITAQVIK